MSLSEIDVLLNYAKEMKSLLAQRWDQRLLDLNQQFSRDALSQDEVDAVLQAEQFGHARFELLLGAQVLLAAWAMLEGAVNHCAAFLANQKGIKARLGAEKDWPAGVSLDKDAGAEERWRTTSVRLSAPF